MDNIGNIKEITEEIAHFYPEQISGAIGYLESRYNLDVHYAAHLASIVWQTLNQQNPWNLPKLAVYLPHINLN